MKKLVQVTFTVNTSTTSYGSPKKYTFVTHQMLEANDMVVVDTVNGYALAEVVGMLAQLTRSTKVESLKEVVCKVDMAAFNARKATAERAKEVKIEMDTRIKEIQEATVYQMFAEKDPALKKLLEEYDALIGD